MNAMIQPMIVQPNSKFTTKMPAASCLWRPTIVGRKYKRRKEMKVNTGHLGECQRGASTPEHEISV
jgi:hypothetical protein